MDERIKQIELDSVDFKKFYEVRAVTAGNSSDGGISLWRASVRAPFVSADKEAPISESRILFIEMPDANHNEARESLRKEVLARISA